MCNVRERKYGKHTSFSLQKYVKFMKQGIIVLFVCNILTSLTLYVSAFGRRRYMVCSTDKSCLSGINFCGKVIIKPSHKS